MSLLEGYATVTTFKAGGSAPRINGLAEGHQNGDPAGWSYYVNGVQTSTDATHTAVHVGDRIWWDWHDWSQTRTVPAVVGSFPEPFLDGVEGQRLPVRVECSQPAAQSCHTVLDRLRSYGVPAALAAISGAYSPDTLRVLVGPFAMIAADPAAHQLEQGPHVSGVYARFSPNGRLLTVLDGRGRATTTLAADTGTVAATRYAQDAPVWLITGTDQSGVTAAAQALGEVQLHDRFAVVLTGGRVLSVPQAPSA